MMHFVEKVEPLKDFILKVIWTDGRTNEIDLVGLIERSKHFHRFLDHPEEFLQVSVIEPGIGIEWGNDLDYSAESLWRMAELQSPVETDFFKSWQSILKISNQEAADILGVSLASVKKYRHGSDVPRPTVLACKSIAREKETMFALYRPRHVGRPANKTSVTVMRAS